MKRIKSIFINSSSKHSTSSKNEDYTKFEKSPKKYSEKGANYETFSDDIEFMCK